MGNQQSSMPDTRPQAVRGPQADFLADTVAGTGEYDEFESIAKPEAPDSTDWPSTAPSALPPAIDDFHDGLPRLPAEAEPHSGRRISGDDHVKPAPPSSPEQVRASDQLSPTLNGVNGTKSRKGKKAKRKRERNSNSLFTQSDEGQKIAEAQQLSPELPELQKEDIKAEETTTKTSRRKRRRKDAGPESQQGSIGSLEVQSPTAQIELESEGIKFDVDESTTLPNPTTEEHNPTKRRKKRRNSVASKRNVGVQDEVVEEGHEWHATKPAPPTASAEPASQEASYESGLNGQQDPAQMEIDDPLLEDASSSRPIATQDIDDGSISHVKEDAVNGEQRDDHIEATENDQNGVPATTSQSHASDNEAAIDGTPRMDFGFEPFGPEPTYDTDQDYSGLPSRQSPAFPAGEVSRAKGQASDDLGTYGARSDSEHSEQESQAVEDAASNLASNRHESSKLQRSVGVEVGQPTLESGDEPPQETANSEAGQDVNLQSNFDEGVSDTDLATALEHITTPLSKSAEQTVALKSSAKQRPKPSFFDILNGNGNATPKTSKRATSATKKSTTKKNEPFVTPSRQNLAAFAQLPASEAVATAKKPRPRPVRDTPATPSRLNRTAFAQLPPDEAVATVKKRGRPRKSIPGTEAYLLASSPARAKMSSQMKGDQNGEGPRSSAGPATSSKQPASQKPGMASGPFTQAELDQIAEAISSFRDSCGMSQFEVNEMVQEPPHARSSTGLHKDLWQRVTASCPSRPRQKVINRTRKIYHNFVGRGTWTPEQDEELRSMVAQHGTKWSLIGGLINRHQEDVRDRWNNYLKGGENRKVDFWSADEEAVLVELAIEMLKEIQKSRGENPDIISPTSEVDIPWTYVSEKMGRTRNPRQCRMKWKQLREANKITKQNDELDFSLTQPEDDVPSRLDKARSDLRKMDFKDKLQLIRAIRKTDVRKDAEIPWSTLVNSKYRRQWSEATLKLLWARLRQTLPEHQKKSTRRVAEKLLREYEEHKQFDNILDMDFDEEEESRLIGSTTPRRKVYRTPRKFSSKSVRSAEFVDESGTKDAEPGDDVEDEQEDEAPTSAQKPAESSDDEEEIPASPTSNEVVPKRRRQQQTDEMDIDDDEDDHEDGARTADRSGSVDLGTTNDEEDIGHYKVGASSPTPQSRPPKKSAAAGVRREKRTESEGSSVNADSFRLKRKRPGLLYKSPTATTAAAAATAADGERTKKRGKKKRKKRKSLTISQDDIEDDSEAERRKKEAAESDADDDMEDIPARLPVRSSEEVE
ncbi:uncharacterized protein E0L32_005086 [Thyridium curvatum]|uniref:Myb transcription factor n=1 Tax=Thyridium curvatum TaxID=1093900 RepID=A0A507BCL5_9PEZI|nr:uncharacterized protein E0L32_005086 [Thyridium curvatum]TPX14691.1 hypothetical protein E0L32_005086 [Thyridium curvatum]